MSIQVTSGSQGPRTGEDAVRTSVQRYNLNPCAIANLVHTMVLRLPRITATATDLFAATKALNIPVDLSTPLLGDAHGSPTLDINLRGTGAQRYRFDSLKAEISAGKLPLPEFDDLRVWNQAIVALFERIPNDKRLWLPPTTLVFCGELSRSTPNKSDITEPKLERIMQLYLDAARSPIRYDLETKTWEVKLPGLEARDEFGPIHYVGQENLRFATLEEAQRMETESAAERSRRSTIADLRRTMAAQGVEIDVQREESGAYTIIVNHPTSEAVIERGVNLSQLTVRSVELIRGIRPNSEAPLLQLHAHGQTLTISTLAGFNPLATTIYSSYPQTEWLPDHRHHSDASGVSMNDEMARLTFKIPEWEAQLLRLTTRFLDGPGARLKSELDIQDLGRLTPRQAVMLSCSMVKQLTKYWTDPLTFPMPPDHTTVMKMLEEGFSYATEGERAAWRGNGACRHFAWAVKAVFEALKEKQKHPVNLLATTYCIAEGGTHYEEREGPKKDTAHAWNTFVSVVGSETVVTVTDVTWWGGGEVSADARIERFANPTSQDIRRARVTALDHTLMRAEQVIRQFAKRVKGPQSNDLLRKVQEYYVQCIRSAEVTEQGFEQDHVRAPLAGKALHLLQHSGAPIGTELDAEIGELYKRNPNFVTFDTLNLWSCAIERGGLIGGRFREVLAQFIEREQWPNDDCRFRLKRCSPFMQRATLEILDGLSKLNGSLDAEMRRLIRVHFPTHLPAFDPKRNESDREELEGHLLHAGEKIRGESHRLEMIRKRQPERYLECLTELDETLREEIRYLGEVAGMVEEATRIAESYQLLQLIWEYDEILRRFDKHEAMLSQN